ncbi:MAG TPA: hypothetical protein VMZ51_05030 [Acidimicrobiales bacterium]|nr:hypothetical protein [Acidimicrobiales bacterium]
MDLEEHARALADGICGALPGWVERSVENLLLAYRGTADASVMIAARQAGSRAVTEVGGRLRSLLAADIDQQILNPLSVVRGAVVYPTGVLREAGVPPVERDTFAEERFPDDDYDLTPTSFADIAPDLRELGLMWGAAKAREHKRRHAGAGDPRR